MSLDLFLNKPDSSAIATFAEFHRALLDAYPETTVSEKVFSVIKDGEHLADIYCFDNERDSGIVQWINVNGFQFDELADFIVSTFGLQNAEAPKEKRPGKKAAKKSIKTLDGGASALPDSKWNGTWLDNVRNARRLKMLDDGNVAPPVSTNLGDLYGFMHKSGYSFWLCYSPERDLYFKIYTPELTDAQLDDFEAIVSREELRLSEYIEAARVAARKEIQTKLTGARFAGLELEYGDNHDELRHVAVVLNVTHEPGPGYTSCDCFRVALPKQPSGETEFDFRYISL